jgi:hypothetical protein
MSDDPTQRFEWWRDPWWQDVLFPGPPDGRGGRFGVCGVCGKPAQGNVPARPGVYGHLCVVCREHCVFELAPRRRRTR